MSATQKRAARHVADLLDGDGDLWQLTADAIEASRREGRASADLLDDVIATLRAVQ